MKRITKSFYLTVATLALTSSLVVQAAPPPGKGPPDGDLGNGNTDEGLNALINTTPDPGYIAGGEGSGWDNTGLGSLALQNNTTGFENTGTGSGALSSNTSGSDNTATGAFALTLNNGDSNTANGAYALSNNSTGSHNVAVGVGALINNTTGSQNTAIGSPTMLRNTTGSGNSALGQFSLLNNTTGEDNTAIGNFALWKNTTGIGNTGLGGAALSRNTTGGSNTAVGINALNRNQTGNNNTALGWGALFPGGTTTFTSGDNNIVLGAFSGTALRSGSNNIYIGNDGVGTESDTIRIGGAISGLSGVGAHETQTATYVAGIFGSTTDAAGVPVYVDSNGKLGTLPSSRQFKEDIAPMNHTSEAILSLQPVTFRYKGKMAQKGAAQFGLIAEEVAKVNPDLVARDESGEIYSVRYEAINAMLLNEFLKEHRKVEDQAATIAELKAAITKEHDSVQSLTAELARERSEIQAVNQRLDRELPLQVADR